MKDDSFNDRNLKKISLKAGDFLFKEGDEGFCFYILQEGKVEVFKTAEDGTETVLGVVEPCQPLGEFALITNSPRSASARAITDGYAIEVSADAYRKLISELPEWAVAVVESLIQRLKSTNQMLVRKSEKWPEEVTESITDVLDKMRS